jgi:hypothetical protein
VVIEDQGSWILIRPIPADPIGAAVGSLAGRGPNSAQLRAAFRDDESAADERKDPNRGGS